MFEDTTFDDFLELADVFTTTEVFAALATMNRSVMPWHFELRNRNGKLFIDTKDNTPIKYTVDESAQEPPSEAKITKDTKRTINDYLNNEFMLQEEEGEMANGFTTKILGVFFLPP